MTTSEERAIILGRREWNAELDAEVKFCRTCGNGMMVIRDWSNNRYDVKTGKLTSQWRKLRCSTRKRWWSSGHDKITQWRNPINLSSSFDYDSDSDW